jgi:hypothetical protein
MKSRTNIDLEAEQIMNSLDGIQKAETPPYFFTRLMARMEGGQANPWNRWMVFLAKPAVSLALVFVFLLINGWLVFSRLDSQNDMGNDYTMAQVSYIDVNPELP